MDWGKAFSISTVQSVKRVCKCSKGYNRICKAIWTSWKFSTGSGSDEIGMYFLILLHKLVVHVSNHISRKMIAKKVYVWTISWKHV